MINQPPNGRSRADITPSPVLVQRPSGERYYITSRSIPPSFSPKSQPPVATNSAQQFVAQRALNDPRYQQLPAATQRLVDYCEAHQLAVCVGPNTQETLEGCDDASLVRDRIIAAQESVPVYDELKSLLWELRTAGLHSRPGQTVYIATHLRGNRWLDEDKLRAYISSTLGPQVSATFSARSLKGLKFVSPANLKQHFGLGKGQVTPFLQANKSQFSPQAKAATLVHVFDADCLKSYGLGMTTNAHHGAWASEFEAAQIIGQLSQTTGHTVFTTDIVVDGPSPTLAQVAAYHQRQVGLIEYGYEATQLFRRRLEHHRKQKLATMYETHYQLNPQVQPGQAKFRVQSIPLHQAGTFNDLMVESKSDPLLERVMAPEAYADEVARRADTLLESLVAHGADTIMIPCNILPHYFTRYYGARVQVLPIALAVAGKLPPNNGPLGHYLFLGGQSVHHPQRSVYQDLLPQDQTLSNQAQKWVEGAMLAVNNQDFKTADGLLFSALKGKNLNTLVMAATSLSVAYHQRGCQLLDPNHFSAEDQAEVARLNSLNIIDTLEVYAQYCAEALFEPRGI